MDGRKVQFTLADGSSVREGYDLLVGADGVGSAVRGALQQYYRDMSVVVTDSGREYKTYRGLKGDIEPEGGCVSIWAGGWLSHSERVDEVGLQGSKPPGGAPEGFPLRVEQGLRAGGGRHTASAQQKGWDSLCC